MGKGLAGRTVWGCSFAAVLLCILMYSLVPTVMAADHTITFVNNCNETIWPGEGGPHPTGWEMAAGATVVKTIPVGTAGLTFWGRTGCTFNESGKCPTQGVDCCKSGGCISSADTTYFGLECASGGQPPVALFEPTFDANSPHGPLDYFDVSLIDGFSHVAIQVTPDAGTYNTDPDPGENPDFWCKPAGYSRTPTCPSDLWDASLNACWGPCKYYTMKLGQSAAGNNGSALCCDATNVSSEPNIPTSWCNPSDPGHADIVGGYKCSPYDWADGYTENTLGCAKGDKYDRRQNLVSCAHGRWADLVDTNWPNMAAQSLEFIKNVNTGAPGAYAWQFDDLKSSYKCRKTDGVVNYTVTFCPGGGATTYALQTSRNGTGAGAVTSSPAGVNCGSTCNATFSAGTVVTLTATAAAGSTFTGWSGGGCSGTGTCAVTMNGNISVTAGFTAATTCTYTIGPRVRTVAYRGGTAPVSITARGASVCPAPTVDVMEGDAYITYSNLTFNKTRGSVKVTVSQNTASATRAGSVYIGGAILPVTQTGKPCSYTISPPTSPIIAKAGGSDSFTLTMSPTDCGWTAQSGAPWITVTSASSGTGSGTVFYTAAENTGRPARSGKVNVALSTGKMKKAHTVRQTNR